MYVLGYESIGLAPEYYHLDMFLSFVLEVMPLATINAARLVLVPGFHRLPLDNLQGFRVCRAQCRAFSPPHAPLEERGGYNRGILLRMQT